MEQSISRQQRYLATEKGKKAKRKANNAYNNSEKGKKRQRRYFQSEKGKEARRKWEQKNREKQDERKPYGKLLLKYRLGNELSIGDLSEKMELSEATIKLWEKGNRGITQANQLKLIEIFGKKYKQELELLNKKRLM